MAIPASEFSTRVHSRPSLLRLPDLRFLSFPWYVDILFDPAFTHIIATTFTSISAFGAAFTYHTRDKNKFLFRALCATTAIGLAATCWTFKNYINAFKSYR
jgi:hypothetical protein